MTFRHRCSDWQFVPRGAGARAHPPIQIAKLFQDVAEVGEGADDLWVFGPVGRLLDLKRALLVLTRALQIAQLLPDDTEIRERAGDLWVIRPVSRLEDSHRAL